MPELPLTIKKSANRDRRRPLGAQPREIAQEFLKQLEDGSAKLDYIDELCKMSRSDNAETARAATAAIFSGIIEYLCDDFSDFGIGICNMVLTRLLDNFRHTDRGGELDRLLTGFGFHSPVKILERYQNICRPRKIPLEQRDKVKKIIILSRTTAGADIAITSLIVHRLSKTFPRAELAIIGPGHLAEMFTPVPNTRFINFIYKNDSGMLDKMTSWPDLLKIARAEQQGFQTGQVLLFDPDTRLTQLGLLPLIDDQFNYYFKSRASQPDHLDHKNLSYLTNNWLNLVLDQNQNTPPALFFQSEGAGYNGLYRALKKNGARFVITINFGVGNNPRKKVRRPFEENLITTILQEPDTVIILDTGRGAKEDKRVRHLLGMAAQKGIATDYLKAKEVKTKKIPLSHGLIAFKGPLCSLGKLISATDCFVGYDSCGQHLAAATGTPTVIIFAGAPSSRFIRRWAPVDYGNTTIPATANLTDTDAGIDSLVNQTHQAVAEIRRSTIALLN